MAGFRRVVDQLQARRQDLNRAWGWQFARAHHILILMSDRPEAPELIAAIKVAAATL